jgi:hypothetical protein
MLVVDFHVRIGGLESPRTWGYPASKITEKGLELKKWEETKRKILGEDAAKILKHKASV